MLAWVVERVNQSKRIDQVVVATTTDPGDDAIVEYCSKNVIAFFRGDVFDVLDRYYQAAIDYQADIVVRVTADCPLIDAQVIDNVIDTLKTSRLDFAANRLPPPYKRTYPIGLDVEAATMQALAEAWQNAKKKHEREHVMPYLYAGSRKFNIHVVDAASDHGTQRWTVDTPEDLEFIRQLTKLLDCRMDFGWLDILALVQEHPELTAINVEVRHKWMDEVDERSRRNEVDPFG